MHSTIDGTRYFCHVVSSTVHILNRLAWLLVHSLDECVSISHSPIMLSSASSKLVFKATWLSCLLFKHWLIQLAMAFIIDCFFAGLYCVTLSVQNYYCSVVAMQPIHPTASPQNYIQWHETLSCNQLFCDVYTTDRWKGGHIPKWLYSRIDPHSITIFIITTLQNF